MFLPCFLLALAASANAQLFDDLLGKDFPSPTEGKAPALRPEPPSEVLPEPELSDSPFAHVGLFYDEFKLTLAPGHRREAAGPFFYRQQSGSESSWGIPPLLSYFRDPDLELKEFAFAYPLLTYYRYGNQYRWQLGQLLSFAGGSTQTEPERHRITLFPVYFQLRSSDPAEDYTAYGPFYGHLKHRLMRDEIFYVMFPFYAQTRKRDTVTDNYVFPLFHLRHGPGVKGWQFWPLAGHEHKEVTTRTNILFNATERVPGYDKKFALWPIYFNQHTDLGTPNLAWEQGVLPFYSFTRSPKRDTTTLLWPLLYHVVDHQKQYEEWDMPWPLIQVARGPGKHSNRFFPFFSHAYNTNLVSDFYLWPLYKHNRIMAAPLDRERTRILFFLYSDTTDKNTETGASRRRVDFWPLFSHHRYLNGNTRLQILAVIEPFLPENPTVEREYAPVYSFWRSERNAKTGATSQSLLWNLYRRETTGSAGILPASSVEAVPVHKKISVLFGLFQYQSGPDGKRLRLFYVPVINDRKS